MICPGGEPQPLEQPGASLVHLTSEGSGPRHPPRVQVRGSGRCQASPMSACLREETLPAHRQTTPRLTPDQCPPENLGVGRGESSEQSQATCPLRANSAGAVTQLSLLQPAPAAAACGLGRGWEPPHVLTLGAPQTHLREYAGKGKGWQDLNFPGRQRDG